MDALSIPFSFFYKPFIIICLLLTSAENQENYTEYLLQIGKELIMTFIFSVLIALFFKFFILSLLMKEEDERNKADIKALKFYNSLEHLSGTSKAIIDSNIKNIYRGENREQLGKQQREIFENIKTGDQVSILALTGRFYIRKDQLKILIDICTSDQEEKGIITKKIEVKPDLEPKKNQNFDYAKNPNPKIRFLIIDPVSRSAILRTVVERSKEEEIISTLKSWSWEKHKISDLYVNSNRTRTKIEELAAKGYRMQVRLTSAAIYCATLITPYSVFVEQYLYGRSSEQKDEVLGGEYPVLEYTTHMNINPSNYKMYESIEQEIIRSNYNILWNHLSITSSDYHERDEEAVFNQNLNHLKSYYKLVDPESKSKLKT